MDLFLNDYSYLITVQESLKGKKYTTIANKAPTISLFFSKKTLKISVSSINFPKYRLLLLISNHLLMNNRLKKTKHCFFNVQEINCRLSSIFIFKLNRMMSGIETSRHNQSLLEISASVQN